jgi:hypothetical protein
MPDGAAIKRISLGPRNLSPHDRSLSGAAGSPRANPQSATGMHESAGTPPAGSNRDSSTRSAWREGFTAMTRRPPIRGTNRSTKFGVQARLIRRFRRAGPQCKVHLERAVQNQIDLSLRLVSSLRDLHAFAVKTSIELAPCETQTTQVPRRLQRRRQPVGIKKWNRLFCCAPLARLLPFFDDAPMTAWPKQERATLLEWRGSTQSSSSEQGGSRGQYTRTEATSSRPNQATQSS